MIALAIILAASTVFIVIAAVRAPMGWQDSTGYHAGEPTADQAGREV